MHLLFLFSCVSNKSSMISEAPSEIKKIEITVAHIEDCEYNRQRKMPLKLTEVKTITIHNTAGFRSAIEERDRLDRRRDNISVSFHYAVDENNIIEIVPPNFITWHAGDGEKGEGNLHSISVEICRSKCLGDDEKLYRKAEENAVVFTAFLLDYYNLPISALRKHQDWSGKYCPHKILSENRWDDFKLRVESLLKETRGNKSSSKKVIPVVVLEFRDSKAIFQIQNGKKISLEDVISELNDKDMKEIYLKSESFISMKDSVKVLNAIRSQGIDILDFRPPTER